MKSSYLTLTLATVILLVAPALVVGGVMKMKTAEISPFPSENEEIDLAGLVYDSERKRIESVRLEIDSEEGADTIRANWIFTGSNSAGSPQRVNLSCFLIDENDKRIASARKSIVLKAGSKEQQDILKMKAKAKAWEAARKVKIQVDFVTLR